VIARAVRDRERIPAQPVHVRVDGHDLVIRPNDVASAMARARRNHKPHNQARVSFVRDMLGRLAEQYVLQLGQEVPADERGEIVEELRTTREIRVALNLAWMPITPQKLVSDLWSKPHRLASAAPQLTPRQRAMLVRDADAPWTPADIPILDEAAELLGEDDQAARAEARAASERRASELAYARQVLESTGSGGMVSAEMLADRFATTGPTLTTAERAAADRSWTYGHVVVDEAQELSAMAWRSLLRRVPTRSLTIVGDVAQTTATAGARSWAAQLDPVLRSSWRLNELTVNYRTPAEVADTARRVAVAAQLPVSPLTSAREVDDSLVVERVAADTLVAAVVERTEKLVADVTDASGAGRIAVIAVGARLADIGGALTSAGLRHVLGTGTSAADLDAPLVVLTPREAKGLEFDVVVLVEPAEVIDASAGDLYVAMTRPTRALHVLHDRPLPRGWVRTG
jgi:DNA helicase IV